MLFRCFLYSDPHHCWNSFSEYFTEKFWAWARLLKSYVSSGNQVSYLIKIKLHWVKRSILILFFSGCSRLWGPSRHDEKIRLDRKKSLHGLDQPQTSTFYKIIEVYFIKLEKAAIFEPFKQCANLADSTLSLSWLSFESATLIPMFFPCSVNECHGRFRLGLRNSWLHSASSVFP